MHEKKRNMFYLQHFFHFQVHLGEKTISDFIYFCETVVPNNGWKIISSTLGAYHKESTLE